MFKRLFGRRGDSGKDVRGELSLTELERESEGDLRGGLQEQDYRDADPRELVVEEGEAPMMGPGGAPQEGESVEERRKRDRS